MANQRTTFDLCFLSIGLAACLVAGGCEEQAPSAPKERSEPSAVRPVQPPPSAGYQSALLLAQAQFVRVKGADGKSQIVPGAAKLTLVYPSGNQWTSEILEDPDSNVFHKAMVFDVPGGWPGILTIGANQAPKPALAKIWRRAADGWQATVLSQATFGAQFNRYRDVEIGDVTGDGHPEIVIATHDQGAVGVLQRKGERWEGTLIDQALNTFVHEIEIGDLDGDGLNEIFATPSAPNRRDGTLQPGQVVMYRYDGEGFSREVVATFEDRHPKEILVAALSGVGPPCLYAVVEPLYDRSTPRADDELVEIIEYRLVDGAWSERRVATLPDRKCRFLHAGDVDHDGRAELIASAFKSGLWMIKPSDQEWEVSLIDGDSSGYEHASALADLDGDGKLEIYVAADDQQMLRRYRWTGEEFERTDLLRLTKGDITFGLMPCVNARCLAGP